MVVGGGGGGVPSDYFVSTQLQLWLFCCWGCGYCWAVTIMHKATYRGVVAADNRTIFCQEKKPL